MFKTPQEIPEDSDRTVPYVWFVQLSTSLDQERFTELDDILDLFTWPAASRLSPNMS